MIENLEKKLRSNFSQYIKVMASNSMKKTSREVSVDINNFIKTPVTVDTTAAAVELDPFAVLLAAKQNLTIVGAVLGQNVTYPAAAALVRALPSVAVNDVICVRVHNITAVAMTVAGQAVAANSSADVCTYFTNVSAGTEAMTSQLVS